MALESIKDALAAAAPSRSTVTPDDDDDDESGPASPAKSRQSSRKRFAPDTFDVDLRTPKRARRSQTRDLKQEREEKEEKEEEKDKAEQNSDEDGMQADEDDVEEEETQAATPDAANTQYSAPPDWTPEEIVPSMYRESRFYRCYVEPGTKRRRHAPKLLPLDLSLPHRKTDRKRGSSSNSSASKSAVKSKARSTPMTTPIHLPSASMKPTKKSSTPPREKPENQALLQRMLAVDGRTSTKTEVSRWDMAMLPASAKRNASKLKSS